MMMVKPASWLLGASVLGKSVLLAQQSGETSTASAMSDFLSSVCGQSGRFGSRNYLKQHPITDDQCWPAVCCI